MAREHWGRRIEFFLTSVGYAVGIGDMWRFPYVVMKNGGGAFLIPVIVFNLVGAIPIVYLEMIMGQYSQTGTIPVWNVCPLLKGVGYGTVIGTFFFATYYAVILCWMLFYLIHSFFSSLPWNACDNEWNIKETCVAMAEEFQKKGAQYATDNLTTVVSNLTTGFANVTLELPKMTSAEQFWRNRVLDLSDGLEILGSVNWPILGCLAAVVIACFLVIFKGIRITGKVVYFTVLGPFILLLVFLIRCAILPGAENGVKFFFTPDLKKLKEPKIWVEGCMQVFQSVGPGFGAIVTFASFNKFNNNCMKDAILLCLVDLFTEIFAGLVIFSILGHVSWRSGIDIESFHKSGYGLGFVVYPEAANYLPPAQLWCAMFFFMSVFLGIDSQFPCYEVVVTAFRDEFPKQLKNKTTLLTFLVVFLAFLLALPLVTEGGFYLLTLIDWYAATFSVTICSLVELIVMTYVYGFNRVNENVKEMTGRGIPIVFKFAWCFVTPFLLVVTLGFTIYTYTPPAVGDYDYPQWAIGLGWCFAAAPLVPIPIYLVYKIYRTPGSIIERFRINLRPNEHWGPQPAVDDKENANQEELCESRKLVLGVDSDDTVDMELQT